MSKKYPKAIGVAGKASQPSTSRRASLQLLTFIDFLEPEVIYAPAVAHSGVIYRVRIIECKDDASQGRFYIPYVSKGVIPSGITGNPLQIKMIGVLERHDGASNLDPNAARNFAMSALTMTVTNTNGVVMTMGVYHRIFRTPSTGSFGFPTSIPFADVTHVRNYSTTPTGFPNSVTWAMKTLSVAYPTPRIFYLQEPEIDLPTI